MSKENKYDFEYTRREWNGGFIGWKDTIKPDFKKLFEKYFEHPKICIPKNKSKKLSKE